MNRMMMAATTVVAGWLGLGVCLGVERVVDFGTALGTNDYVNDRDLSFEAVGLNNYAVADWNYWEGFAASRMTNTTDGGMENQYSAAGLWTNSTGYAVAFPGWYETTAMSFDLPAAPQRVWVNNTAYAADSLANGDGYARAFTNGDFFVVRLTGHDISGEETGMVAHYLADFRDGQSFIQRDWEEVDLTPLGDAVVEIEVSLETTDVGPYGAKTPTYVALADLAYAYASHDSPSIAIPSTSTNLVTWASEVIAYSPATENPVDPFYMVPSNALGAAQGAMWGNGATNGVVTLGDGGSIVLGFPVPIHDAPGPDFAVFENAFADTYLELAYVEVSSNGKSWIRFPNHCLETIPIDEYGKTNASSPTAYGGLACKTIQGYGTAFDLAVFGDAAAEAGVDLSAVRYVRLIDIPGDGSCLDSYGNPIYDPWPTRPPILPAPGFDLDAVGVLSPSLRISLADAENPGAAPAMPEYRRVLLWKADLASTNDWTEVDTMTPNGFYCYRFDRINNAVPSSLP